MSTMRAERVYTDTSFHPSRRRVKYLPIVRARAQDGTPVVVDNSDWVGDYPILWSRKVEGGILIVFLVSLDGVAHHSVITEEDFLKLPETDIEW